jgi:hypothetical protein
MAGMIVRTGMIAIAALILAAAIVSVSAAGVFRERNPAIALTFAPWDARASAKAAQQSLLRRPTRRSIAAAGEQARQAYRLEPLALTAVTTMGIAADARGEAARAAATFTYAARLSRRNVEAQIWLVEHNVRRDDIGGALAHYNVLLSTSTETRSAFSGILINASSRPEIALAVNRLLLARPNWRDDFLTRFVFEGRDPAALATVSRRVLNSAAPEDREILLRVLARLAELGRYDLAWDAYRDAMRQDAGERTAPAVRNGDFASDQGLPPFDWRYPADGRLVPERRPAQVANRNFALYLPTDPGQDTETASQLVRLAAGSYELGAIVGDTPGEQRLRPFLRVRCAGEPVRDLLSADFPQAPPEGRAMAAAFVVPANCPYQWLSIWVRDQGEGARTTPWVTAISLRRR